jgi:hypothetical protein
LIYFKFIGNFWQEDVELVVVDGEDALRKLGEQRYLTCLMTWPEVAEEAEEAIIGVGAWLALESDCQKTDLTQLGHFGTPYAVNLTLRNGRNDPYQCCTTTLISAARPLPVSLSIVFCN